MAQNDIYDAANEVQMQSENFQTQEHSSCSRTVTRCSEVCVPIRVNPIASVGEPITRCCGRPEVTVRENALQQNCPCGCNIVVRQCVCVSIPITYCTAIDVQPTEVDCMSAQMQEE